MILIEVMDVEIFHEHGLIAIFRVARPRPRTVRLNEDTTVLVLLTAHDVSAMHQR